MKLSDMWREVSLWLSSVASLLLGIGLQSLGMSPMYLILGAVGCGVFALLAMWLHLRSHLHTKWRHLGQEFLRIAEADSPGYGKGREKTYATMHSGQPKFGGGVVSSHPALCEALSMTAGRMLRWSKARHVSRWSRIDPRGRWIQFAASHLRTADPKAASDNINAGSIGEPDQYLHVAVFPYAAYLACEYCASLETFTKQSN